MPQAVISGTGLYQPPHIITNAELVQAFNAYAEAHNTTHAEAIARGDQMAMVGSSVEFIEKASGIKQRYVIDKQGVLDPARMYPRFEPRPDDQLSLMAEIAVDASRKALAAAGRTGADVDAVFCAAANMQRAYPAMAVEIQNALGAGGACRPGSAGRGQAGVRPVPDPGLTPRPAMRNNGLTPRSDPEVDVSARRRRWRWPALPWRGLRTGRRARARGRW